MTNAWEEWLAYAVPDKFQCPWTHPTVRDYNDVIKGGTGTGDERRGKFLIERNWFPLQCNQPEGHDGEHTATTIERKRLTW